MSDPRLLILIALGLILWLAPFTGWASRLNDVGKWCAVLAFAALLWSWVG
jgi:hypothetical protein